MFIKELNLIGFRNYIQESLRFESNKTILIGKNAQGKSNLLEVIQIVSLGKSQRAGKDAELINWDMESAIVSLKTSGQVDHDIAVEFKKSGRRAVKLNEKKIKPGDLPGHVLSVSFMVDDLQIVYGSPSKRRDWLDALLAQLSKTYRDKLKAFEKALQQRNKYIKSLLEQDIYYYHLKQPNRQAEREQLEIWDDLYLETANALIQERLDLVGEIIPASAEYYSKIASSLDGNSGVEELLTINYLGEEMSKPELEACHEIDFIRGHTTTGPHRHDLEFLINEKSAASFASQGQRRTIVLALKLAELDLVKEKHEETPILLLDDVLAELDEDRQDYLLDAVQDDTQVIVTTTHLGKHLEKWQANAQILTIDKGSIKGALATA